MTKQEVIDLLEKNKDERGIKNWEKAGLSGMSSFGIGLTKLKKLARQIGRDHELALELWEENNFECKTLSTIIDEPKKVGREQIEHQVADLDFWMLSHSYCSNLMPKHPRQKEIAEQFMVSKNNVKRRCGFLLLYNLAKDDKNLEDSYFVPFVLRIENELQSEENFVKDAMNHALWMIGQRNKSLNELAISAAKSIGKVHVDYGDNSCQAIDVVAHLTSERIQNKLQ